MEEWIESELYVVVKVITKSGDEKQIFKVNPITVEEKDSCLQLKMPAARQLDHNI